MAVACGLYPSAPPPAEHALRAVGRDVVGSLGRTMDIGDIFRIDPEKLFGRKRKLLKTGDSYTINDSSEHPKFTVTVVQLDGLDKDLAELVELKLNAIREFSHPGVIRYHRLLRRGNVIFIVADHCGCSLGQFIADHRVACEPVPKKLLLSILGQLADALAYLHDPDKVGTGGRPLSATVHRNLEPTSILIEESDQRVVITNFGLCKGTSSRTARAGDPAYAAPEALLRGAATPASDVWSLGAVAYELATLRKPDFLGGRDPAEAFVAWWSPDLSGVADNFIRSVLGKMLALDPAERLTARELVCLLRMASDSTDEQEAQDTRLIEVRAALAVALTRASDGMLALEKDPTSSAAKVDSIKKQYAIAAMLLGEMQKIKAEMGESDEPDETEESEESEESDEPEKKHLIEEDDSTDLMRAVDRSDVEAVKTLTPLQGGVKMKGCALVGDWKVYEGTALMRAAVYGHAEIVELLAEKEEGLRDSDGWTALMCAAAYGHVHCVKLLLEKEGGMQCDDGWTALMSAAKHGYTDCLRLLLEKESGVQDNEGWTALMSAAKHGHIDCLNLLLEREGGVRDNEGGTALMWAAESGHADCVRLLMEKEGGIQGSNGWTALIVAAEHGKADCVELLLEREGGLQKTDGTTALIWAAQNGHTSCVRLLADKEAGMQDNNGWTALIFAAQGGYVECVKLLMREKGLRDYSGWTALDVARRWRDHEIVALLSE
ncbi:Kinase, NEK [Giardia lamblia P15]|uniref:Kinase, NEK n=1 Tax=Giardia intestinalis (strain P15) TaxID=658858 RepID=E1F7Y0_GIAIA|nr:Kinase, NEK [Giardia lamblia P15]